ncbi:spermidine synthase SpeE [Gottschalkia acidurici 9a]|uniref:Polyamine aminopropyltransferase n=1 Tax=Gottschalkia acidurici (strain ATCC 7906 / DSM 604 / BCRC 14475 / CIP 104303 / KCTC 5404 / NCIMB 10678 / 9a) TaxID=1128398 RepID=K0B2N0_GOTA9|nr:polyamine aminopropyltransferase [Gottschalkia acidurici]AFS79754.1 spermidine synthase SpeE [Gottschalkia acidurici 9a]
MNKVKTFNYKVLMLTTLIISGCSIIYEVLISSISSFLVGDSIKQFSITIGLYMSAMGLGSYLSKYIKTNLFDWFVAVEIGVGVLGGISTLILFLSNIYIESYELIMYIEIILIGTFVGFEIPILTRIIEDNTNNLRITLSTIFSFDYIGGLIGSIAFPLVLLPNLGYFTTAFLVGSLNIVVSLVIVYRYKEYIKNIIGFKVITISILAVMISGVIFSDNIANSIEGKLYRDKVILSQQTKYQNIVVTKHKDDLRVFIDGNIQFSASDEYRYHESLVHIPMNVAKRAEKVLILGGGDGLAVREVLKYPEVKKITLVDLDEEMVKLSMSNKHITKINNNSLSNEKVELIYDDAFNFIERCKEIYDVIIVDLPDPNNESLNKLYTNVFYRLCGNILSNEGAMSVQSTSPYYAKEAYWCINKTIEEEGFNVTPYHVEVPTFGDWGFQLATKIPMDTKHIKLDIETKFLNDEAIDGLFKFSKDEIVNKNEITTNTLVKPQLLKYYLDAVNAWR